MSQKIMDKILPKVLKFVSSKPISAIKDGVILTMPLTIVGSIFLLIGCFPITGYSDFMISIFGNGWDKVIWQVVGATFDIMALIGVFGIAYTFVKNEKYDGVSAGILGIVAFLIVNSSFIMVGDKAVGGVIPKIYTGGKGMIGAIIIGLIVGYIYSFCMRKKLIIKLPDGVPEGVSKAFLALIPGLFIMVFFGMVFVIFDKGLATTFMDFIYKVIQTPLQGMSSTLAGAILMPLLVSLLWWCGIHGSAIVSGIMMPILMANSIANQEIIKSGTRLVVGQNAHIVTAQFLDQYITFTGSGITLGLVISMLFLSKSSQFKELGKMSIIPGIFNINEPIIFGTPIVFNPIMLIPFVGTPVLSGIVTYSAIKIGLVAPFGGVLVPWTTPPLIGGFLVGGIRGAILQLFIIIMSVMIYLPFMKVQDKINLKSELESK